MDWRKGGRRRLLKHRHFVSSLSRHRSFAHVTRLVTMQRTRSIASATGSDVGHDVPATCSLAATCARTDGPSADSPVCVRSTAASLLSSRLCILLRLCWLPLDVRRMRLPHPRGRVLRCAHWRTSLGALPAGSGLLVHRVSCTRCYGPGLRLKTDLQCHRLRPHRRRPLGCASSCRRTGVVRLCRRRTRFVVRPGSHQYVSLSIDLSRRRADLAPFDARNSCHYRHRCRAPAYDIETRRHANPASTQHYNTRGPGNARYFSIEKQPLPPPGRRRRAALYAASGVPAGRLGAESEEQAFSLEKRQRRSGRETWSSESEGDGAEEELREKRARAAQRTVRSAVSTHYAASLTAAL